jgi:DNA replicative helicase MCM subunit Mcm2 (Cdc46/Mcm family)
MTSTARSSINKTDTAQPDESARASAVLVAIDLLLSPLSSLEREQVRRKLLECFGASVEKPLMSAILDFVQEKAKRQSDGVRVSEIKEEVIRRGIETRDRTIYNAIGHLARQKVIRQIEYGRYILADGSYIETSEELPCAPPRHLADGDLGQ